jgi:serine/threonine-protein kinase
MTPERWAEIKRVFDACAEAAPSEARRILAEHDADPELVAHVRELLSADEEAGAFLEHSPVTTSDSPAAKAGDRVGPYEVIRHLGEGGMAQVFLARRIGDRYRQPVALKVIRGGQNSRRSAARFNREQRLLHRLDHPNIVGFIEAGVSADGMQFVAMEYVDGTPFDEFFAASRAGLRERLACFAVLCDAVHHAHEAGVIHRDLKPSNVLVTAAGVPMVLDFGIAKPTDPSGTGAIEITGTGQRPMTPAYASPEQTAGEPVSPASDVYSLGLILHVALTGKPPELSGISGDRGEEGAAGHSITTLNGRALPKLVARDISLILSKSLQRDPLARYQTAAALAADVRCVANGRPLASRRGSVLYSLSTHAHRLCRTALKGAAQFFRVPPKSLATQAQAAMSLASKAAAHFEGREFEAAQESFASAYDSAGACAAQGYPSVIRLRRFCANGAGRSADAAGDPYSAKAWFERAVAAERSTTERRLYSSDRSGICGNAFNLATVYETLARNAGVTQPQRLRYLRQAHRWFTYASEEAAATPTAIPVSLAELRAKQAACAAQLASLETQEFQADSRLLS